MPAADETVQVRLHSLAQWIGYKPLSLIQHVHNTWGAWSKGEGGRVSVERPVSRDDSGSRKKSAEAGRWSQQLKLFSLQTRL